MTTTKTAASYSPEMRERAVRLVLEGNSDHPTQWVAISSVSAKIGCPETFNTDQGKLSNQAGPPHGKARDLPAQ